jgi:predicted AlkP superfamily pyrophosphatase or phosphodiesterase
MSYRSLLHGLVVLAFSGLALSAQSDRHVVVVSLDGLPAYALDDPALPMPTLRKLIRDGASATRMTAVNPSVTWPNHTTMSTGVGVGTHGVYANGTIVRADAPLAKVEPWIEKTKMIHSPTIYDVAFQAGLTTAEVQWAAIYKAPTITWAFPEIPTFDHAVVKEMLAAGLVTSTEIENFRHLNSYRRDQLWTAAAVHIIKNHRPNLLLFHLASIDSSNHNYGPKTHASLASMAFADECLAHIWEALQATGPAALLVVSDHGFKTFHNQIQMTAALRGAGISDVDVIAEGGSALVYFKPGREAELSPKVRALAATIAGIAGVVGHGEMSKLGLPEPGTDPQTPDMILLAKDDYAFAGAKSGPALTPIPDTRGTHGYASADPDMDAVFVAWGRGVKPGARLERISNLDVAPTIAALLGIPMPTAQGKPAKALLQ